MGLFSTPDEDRLAQLFGSSELSNIVRRELVDNLVQPNWLSFDLEVTVERRAIGIFRGSSIGVTYFPNGPVTNGVQAIDEGETRVFRNIPVKRGAELVVAMADSYAVSWKLSASGTAPEPQVKSDSGGNTLGDLGKGLGEGVGTALVVGGIILAIVLWAKKEAGV